MLPLLLGVLCGAVVTLVLAGPLFASWPTRVRWLVHAQVPDPMLGLPAPAHTLLSEARVVDLETRDHSVEVSVVELPAGRPRVLVAEGAAPGLVARLEGWLAVREPLLLIIDGTDRADLAGPDTTFTGLRVLPAPGTTIEKGIEVKNGRGQQKKPAAPKVKAPKVKPQRQAKMAHRDKSA
jgi:hypothetical protein